MKVVRVATSDGRAYYSILSRLKRTHLRFVSVVPSTALGDDSQLIITTRKEMGLFDCLTIPIEDLSEDPLVMEGQVLSKVIAEQRRVLVIGVDPGSRIGVAVYYGGMQLGALSVNSNELLRKEVSAFTQLIPHVKATIKIGDGAPRLSASLVRMLLDDFPDVMVEVVDERGTSTRASCGVGLTNDQGAAARIALRKGIMMSRGVAC